MTREEASFHSRPGRRRLGVSRIPLDRLGFLRRSHRHSCYRIRDIPSYEPRAMCMHAMEQWILAILSESATVVANVFVSFPDGADLATAARFILIDVITEMKDHIDGLLGHVFVSRIPSLFEKCWQLAKANRTVQHWHDPLEECAFFRWDWKRRHNESDTSTIDWV